MAIILTNYSVPQKNYPNTYTSWCEHDEDDTD